MNNQKTVSISTSIYEKLTKYYLEHKTELEMLQITSIPKLVAVLCETGLTPLSHILKEVSEAKRPIKSIAIEA